jgi:hypothetical protein
VAATFTPLPDLSAVTSQCSSQILTALQCFPDDGREIALGDNTQGSQGVDQILKGPRHFSELGKDLVALILFRELGKDLAASILFCHFALPFGWWL